MNYSEKEGNCKCGCGAELSPRLLIANQAFIFILERKFKAKVRHIITSGSRCPEHNEKEGGSPTSQHIDNLATDGIFQENSSGPWKQISNDLVARIAIKSGLFGGVGWQLYKDQNKNLIHLDIRPGDRVKVW